MTFLRNSYDKAVAPFSALTGWIADHVSFPNRMVDRITPMTTADDIEWLAGWRKDQPGPSSERSGCSRSNRSCHIPRGQRLEPAHRLGLPELPTPVAFRVRHRQAVLDRVADLSDGDNLLGAA